MTWWIDAGAGASGDMLLGALLDLDPTGLPVAQAAVDKVVTDIGAARVTLSVEPVRRNGMAATRALLQCHDDSTHRTWADIEPFVTGRAHAVFEALARAEAAVHGVPVQDIHFHEVGALDAIADIVAVTALWERLAPDRIVVSPVCVGSGSVPAAHGMLTVPGPAVTRLLQTIPTFGGPVEHEACTPTGAALLKVMADGWGPQPLMAVAGVGVGAGGRDTEQRPNVLRVLAGSWTAQAMVQLETTIDDLDPRLYPEVMAATKAAGAVEAWLAPIIIKHGRPGVVLTALVPTDRAKAVTDVLFGETTTLGVRQWAVDRTTLDRDYVEVTVKGQRIRVKRGLQAGKVVTEQPEYHDVVRAAEVLGLPVRRVLEEARKAPREQKSSDAADGGDSDVRTPKN